MKNSLPFQIILSIGFTIAAILLGFLANYEVFEWKLNLIGIAIFIMPFFLKIQYSVISTTLAVLATGFLNDGMEYVWISLIAYVGAVSIISLFRVIKLKIIYFALILAASLFIVATHFYLEAHFISNEFAFKNIITVSIEVGVVITVSLAVYLPMRILSKVV